MLYIFTNDGGEYSGDYRDTRKGKPSFNPGCLKWQVRAKIPSRQYDNILELEWRMLDAVNVGNGRLLLIMVRFSGTGIPQVSRNCFPDGFVVKPCVAEWHLAVSHSRGGDGRWRRFSCRRTGADTVNKVAEMG